MESRVHPSEASRPSAAAAHRSEVQTSGGATRRDCTPTLLTICITSSPKAAVISPTPRDWAGTALLMPARRTPDTVLDPMRLFDWSRNLILARIGSSARFHLPPASLLLMPARVSVWHKTTSYSGTGALQNVSLTSPDLPKALTVARTSIPAPPMIFSQAADQLHRSSLSENVIFSMLMRETVLT